MLFNLVPRLVFVKIILKVLKKYKEKPSQKKVFKIHHKKLITDWLGRQQSASVITNIKPKEENFQL